MSKIFLVFKGSHCFLFKLTKTLFLLLLMQIDSGTPISSVITINQTATSNSIYNLNDNSSASNLNDDADSNSSSNISRNNSDLKKASSAFFIPNLRSRKSFSGSDSPSISSYALTSFSFLFSVSFSFLFLPLFLFAHWPLQKTVLLFYWQVFFLVLVLETFIHLDKLLR